VPCVKEVKAVRQVVKTDLLGVFEEEVVIHRSV